MNWLAHLYLAETTPAHRVGGILPDILPVGLLRRLGPAFADGIQRHYQIDQFTDTHPVFRRSVERFAPPLRRFAGIIVDVLYDHALACAWSSYCPTPLLEFTVDVYGAFEACSHEVPPEAMDVLTRIREGDWLCSYQSIEGIATALGRIGRRFRRPVDLTPAVRVFEQARPEFLADFAEFFPQLQAHLAGHG